MLKRFLTFALLLMMSVLLVACGGTDDSVETTDTDTDTSETTTDNTASDTEPELTFTVTGAVDAEYSDSANLFCDDGDGITDPFLELGNLGTNSLLLNIPAAVEAGTIEVVGADDAGFQGGSVTYVKYTDENRTNYQSGSGEIVLETMPTAEGDMLVGTLTAELSDDDGNTVNISAMYNVLAGTQSFDDCNGEGE